MQQDLFAARKSQRHFLPDEVPQALVEKLLNAALEAPSAGNRQPWHFYAVRNPALKAQLCEHAYRQTFIEQAPVVIVVCAEPARSAERYEARGETLYCLQDTAAAIENILLCATQHGLGSCWCGAFDEAGVSQALDLSPQRRPVAILPIGLPGRQGNKPRRRPMAETVTFMD